VQNLPDGKADVSYADNGNDLLKEGEASRIIVNDWTEARNLGRPKLEQAHSMRVEDQTDFGF
jgi:hypothetical protein